MTSDYSVRITKSMIPKYIGKTVTVVGKVEAGQISHDGSSFVINCSGADNKNEEITITLSQPLNDIVDGILEVIGVVDQQCNIQCIKYYDLPPSSTGALFNISLYNETINLIHKSPQYFAYKVGMKRRLGD